MKITQTSQHIQPLEQVTLTDIEPIPENTLVVRDGLGRVYGRLAARPTVQFVVLGALGHHHITLESAQGIVLDELTFHVDTETAINDQGGLYRELLGMLYYTKIKDGEYITSVRYQNRVYRCFVGWLRDDVHEMKGMKYFSRTLKDTIDLYRDSQRADGMIWDNVTLRGPEPNYWETRFAPGDFIRVFDDFSAEFKRIPVENDVEYLFVEGLYFTWKAVSDDRWMMSCLEAAKKALDYSISDHYRWSEKYQLLKRGYTIDTWDFQSRADSVVNGDAMLVDPEKTHFGIFFGDNTGYAMACDYLAEMLDYAGSSAEAQLYRQRAQDIRERLVQLSWNGHFFTHHIPEHPERKRDLGVNEVEQISLSNAYSLNRHLPHELCVSIIQSYQDLKAHLPEGSPGEWYTIYPPFLTGFGGYKGIWQYMNSGVTPIVAGELAHGAFEHGFEDYGVDILKRLFTLGKHYGGLFHSVYTGAFPSSPRPHFQTLDIAPQANTDVSGTGAQGVPGWIGEGDNDLHEVPYGLQEMAGIPFLLPDPEKNGRRAAIGISNRAGYSSSVTLQIQQTAKTIYFLHTVAQTEADGVAGTITLHYADGSKFTRHVVKGYNVQGWWLPQTGDQQVTQVAWRGKNAHCLNVGVLAYGLQHPFPDKHIDHITLSAVQGNAFWGVLGITLSDQAVSFPVSPISYGIPNGWATSAVIYALIEGLVGVVDHSTGYKQVAVAPRWSAADVHQVSTAVKYPASDGYIAYRYTQNTEQECIAIEFTGSGTQCDFHVLLPAEATSITAVTDGIKQIEYTQVQIEKSLYADFRASLQQQHQVCIFYTTRN